MLTPLELNAACQLLLHQEACREHHSARESWAALHMPATLGQQQVKSSVWLACLQGEQAQLAL